MGQAAAQTRENRTITVDFHDESTYFQLLNDGKALVEFVLAFILSLGFQLTHKSTCNRYVRGTCKFSPQCLPNPLRIVAAAAKAPAAWPCPEDTDQTV